MVVLLVMGGLYRSQALPPVNRLIDRCHTALSLTISEGLLSRGAQATSVSYGKTPVFSIVRNVRLSKTYYYRFNTNLPADGRDVFETAVATYNRTGLVHLKPGTATLEGNQITFGAYHQKARGTGKIELGHGGPEIIRSWNDGGSTAYNEATASLNMAYPQAFNDAVAVHELGHALGLEHSQVRDSVMYPTDQGNTDLTKADLTALRSLYPPK